MSGTPRRMDRAGDPGFAAVDALVALLILSSTLVLSLSGLQTAARLSRIAAETAEATSIARGVLANPAGEDGHAGDLSWSVKTQSAAAAASGSGLCQRRVLIHSIRDGRVYRFATAGACG